MKKTAGRKSKLTLGEVRKVIKLFKEREQPSGLIKYADIHRFANELYEENIISSSTSDAFWRKEGRLGRIEVDQANVVFSEAFITSKGDKINVPNVVDLVEKKYKNKDELLLHLVEMEKQFHLTLEREKKLQKKVALLEGNLNDEKAAKQKLIKSNDELQGLVHRLFRILSETPDQEIKDKTEYAMKTVFDSPVEFLKQIGEPLRKEEKVVPIVKRSSRFRK